MSRYYEYGRLSASRFWTLPKLTMLMVFRAPEPLTEAERAELDELHRHGRKEVIAFRRKSWLRLRSEQ